MELSRVIIRHASARARGRIAAGDKAVAGTGLFAFDRLVAGEACTFFANLACSAGVLAAAAMGWVCVDVHAFSVAQSVWTWVEKSVHVLIVRGHWRFFEPTWDLLQALFVASGSGCG